MGINASTPTCNSATDIPDLKWKVFLVTGASSGIGYETVAELLFVSLLYWVHVGTRNESRATGAIAKLRANGYLDSPGAGEVLSFELDLSTPERARRAAKEFMQRETRLDVLNKLCGSPLVSGYMNTAYWSFMNLSQVNNAGTSDLALNAFEPVQDAKVPAGTLMST
ncbi:hypothetical protein FRB98_004083, partial [Tulasnella sp. 332]